MPNELGRSPLDGPQLRANDGLLPKPLGIVRRAIRTPEAEAIILDLADVIERLARGVRRSLGRDERFFFSELLRDAADEIENPIASEGDKFFDVGKRPRSH